MPSEKSMQEQEYYAHPQNRFWTVLAAISLYQLDLYYNPKYTHPLPNARCHAHSPSLAREGDVRQDRG